MAESEYKALTFVNLPFIEERYAPGDFIPHDRFEAMAEQAAALLDDRTSVDESATPIWEAQDHIDELMANGSISDDPDAELHPAHLPVDLNRPNLPSLVARAQELVNELEEAGSDVPSKLREFAEISDRQITAVERGLGGGENAGG